MDSILTASECRALGYNNAREALDQAGGMGLAEAVDAYGQNLLDTLGENGVRDGDPVIIEATSAFLDLLHERGVTHKPHGF